MTATAVEKPAVREATAPAVTAGQDTATGLHALATAAVLALVGATELVWAAGLAYGAYLLLG